MSKSTCPCEQIYASATYEGVAITISGDIVTANASATASSAVSYEDALSIATKDAEQLANNYAQHDADVIDQTLTIVNSRSLIPTTADITIGSTTSPYSQIYTAKGVVLSSNSPGNQVILNGSNNKLYANGAQVYTTDNPQGSDSSGNTFYGTAAGLRLTTGADNSGFGVFSLAEITSGSQNVSVGKSALQFNRTGNYNAAVGYLALGTNNQVEGNYNTAVGYLADVIGDGLSNSTSIGNGAICTASNQITLGNNSVTSLVCAGSATINGVTLGRGGGNIASNTALGTYSLQSNTVGIENTASGLGSLRNNTTGSQNTASGYGSLFANKTGNYNTAFGAGADVGEFNLQNCTSIGYGAICDTSDQITLGNSSVTALRCHVTSITSLSDRRDKKDVEDLESSLEFIEQLKPVRFNWNMRDGGKVDIPEIGFIAQDLQQAQQDTGMKIPNLVYDVNPEKLEASYGALLPLLVKSIQELSQDNKRLNAKIQELIAKNQ